MAESKSLESPRQVDRPKSGYPEAHHEDTSDSDDQFIDARSGQTTPNIRSPTPKANTKQKDAIREEKPPQDSEHEQEEVEHKVEEVRNRIHDNVDEGVEEKEADISSKDTDKDEEDEDDADDFGDDFDDFEEGGGADNGFDDFDESDFAQPEPAAMQPQTPVTPQHRPLPFAIPDFDGLGPDEVIEATEDILYTLYPPEMLEVPAPQELPKDASVFINPRSASLWSQLVAPPPLAPPDWIRSRTRRLFLVSLGVPVDLDEILPASKQKKLILPSLNLNSSSPRASSDARGNGTSRLKQGDGNASSTSVDSQDRPSASKTRRGLPAEPDLDLVAARYLCNTTDEALGGMTDEELKAHVAKLEAMQGAANDVLEYWKKRTDEKLGDREAFEGVIENLVKHARKVRK
ncbi:hypothetical protein ISF_00032 [Cordyceps fumosorosea ARSEF 2679]|uniref:Uncharacterized protein n=1 Tax=Cordyceps fumosorosea (strain ARSEF 2679) TaxID=1081104 RepID=A0A168DXN1_CORFA|nr:hypothetical protein ISF_00032 [Cordyceps fumosorosea ARSEF 2679]OAA73131.1 hypothetical protein ISF_00032 [Cordyceps fumosorosea ARSEF 2679]